MYTSMQAAQQEKLKNKEAENSELRKEKKKVESEMQKLKADLSKKEIKLKEFEKENATLKEALQDQERRTTQQQGLRSPYPANPQPPSNIYSPLPSQPGFATPYEQPNPSNLISHPIAPFYPTPYGAFMYYTPPSSASTPPQPPTTGLDRQGNGPARN
jgi:hypothetical protein